MALQVDAWGGKVVTKEMDPVNVTSLKEVEVEGPGGGGLCRFEDKEVVAPHIEEHPSIPGNHGIHGFRVVFRWATIHGPFRLTN